MVKININDDIMEDIRAKINIILLYSFKFIVVYIKMIIAFIANRILTFVSTIWIIF